MKIDMIFDKLVGLEDKYDLFNKKISNVYFWKIVRFHVHKEILKQLGLVELNQNNRSGFIDKLQRIIGIFKNNRYSIYKNTRQRDVLVFENSRKLVKNNKYYDPYTFYYVEEMKKESINYAVIDEGLQGEHFGTIDNNQFYAEDIYTDILNKIVLKLKPIAFNEDEIKLLNVLSEEILDVYKCNIDICCLAKKWITFFNGQCRKYDKLFKLIEPKQIYLVCSYGKEGMIYAAQKNGIEVIEFQHGIISLYHTGYSFPSHKQISYFPDKMLMFGKYWYDSAAIPLDNNHIEFIGFTDLNKTLEETEVDLSKDKRILIISQWIFEDKLSNKAVEIARNNPEYHVTYRLHPQELTYNWRQKNKTLCNNLHLENLEVDECKNSLHQELATSEYVVGVYSTTIYESLALECKVILIDLYGVEYMNYLIDNKYVTKIGLEEKIDFRTCVSKKIDKQYFFGGDIL